MASHGVPRASNFQPTTDQDRRNELKKIDEYKGLVESINFKINGNCFTAESLDLTSKILRLNPEYYTIWNHRRLVVQKLLLLKSESPIEPDESGSKNHVGVFHTLTNELNFLIPLLRKFSKCYWIWNYRLWLLEESAKVLPLADLRTLWEQELMLAGKMLNLDSRNFHGWGYRRTVTAALERILSQMEETTNSRAEQEFVYTTKMINVNLSNFSAWHNRSKLIPRLLNERKADDGARRKFLDEELELIQRALWAGDHDQSLWFYHQYLTCTFDDSYASESMAPNLSVHEKLEYLTGEIEKVLAMLDGAEDCKWIYQSLIHLSMLWNKLGKTWPPQTKAHLWDWIDRLREIDPLRGARWTDLEKEVSDVSSSS